MQPVGESGKKQLNLWVGQVLLWGVVISLLLMLLGFLVLAVSDAALEDVSVPLSQVIPQVQNLSYQGILALGILVLLATPVVSVLLITLILGMRRERLYPLLSLGILVILLLEVAWLLR